MSEVKANPEARGSAEPLDARPSRLVTGMLPDLLLYYSF